MITITLTEDKINQLKQYIQSISDEVDKAEGEIDNKYDDENILYASRLGAELWGFHQALDMIGINLSDYETQRQ